MKRPLDLVLHRIYLAGYHGYRPARSFRRLLAKSIVHRAWLAGYMGIYTESDKLRVM